MKSIVDIIKDFCRDYELDFMSDYSGRCMYGRTCIGVVCTDVEKTLLMIADAIRDEGYESVSEELGSPSSDNMGLARILYFPEVTCEY